MAKQDHDEHNLLVVLVEQARSLAARLSGNQARTSACHFCGGPLPLWENVLVLQLTGVPAHVQCPEERLREWLARVGPRPEFDYETFSRAVDRRVEGAPDAAPRAGVIDAG